MGEPTTTLLGFFLSAATAFSKLLGWLGNEDRSRRERVATYFDQIAACMREVAERIEAGDPPRDTCSRLAVYADELQRILGERNYWISASDASVEATRSRLAREIKQTQRIWMQVGETMNERRKREAALVAQSVTREAIAGRHGSHPMTPKATIDRLTDQFEDEFAGHIDVRRSVQQIWDAAGEFAALADALRAR
jgi:hypothetical protein